MWNTFVNSSRIRRAYSVNSIITWLRSLPIFGKLISYSEFADGPIKKLAKFLSVFKSIITFCLSEIIYILILLGASVAASSITAEDTEGFINMSAGNIFINLFFFLALIGIPLNNILFDVTEDKYYSIVLMRMDARKYALSDMFYKVFRKSIGYIIMFTIMCLTMNFKPLILIAFLLLTVMGKFLGAYIKLKFIEKDKLSTHSGITVILILIIFVTGGLLTVKGISFSHEVIYAATGVICLLGAFALYKLCTYQDYIGLCKNFLKQDLIFNTEETKTKTNKENASKSITMDTNEEAELKGSNKEGYAYFNEIFVRRHSSLLRKKSKILSIIISILCVGGLAVLSIGKSFFGMEPISKITPIMYSMPLILYFINSGETLAQAMFINCDSAMLTYNFYRKPEVILGVFKSRLLTIIRLNLIPSFLIACALSVFCAFSTVANNPLNYVAFFIFCPALSVFFSLHRLVTYYLLQPYTEGMEMKRSGYNLANTITYIVTYMIFMANDSLTLSPIAFALICVGFCIIYVPVALFLVYKFAPGRFRIHK